MAFQAPDTLKIADPFRAWNFFWTDGQEEAAVEWELQPYLSDVNLDEREDGGINPPDMEAAFQRCKCLARDAFQRWWRLFEIDVAVWIKRHSEDTSTHALEMKMLQRDVVALPSILTFSQVALMAERYGSQDKRPAHFHLMVDSLLGTITGLYRGALDIQDIRPWKQGKNSFMIDPRIGKMGELILHEGCPRNAPAVHTHDHRANDHLRDDGWEDEVMDAEQEDEFMDEMDYEQSESDVGQIGVEDWIAQVLRRSEATAAHVLVATTYLLRLQPYLAKADPRLRSWRLTLLACLSLAGKYQCNGVERTGDTGLWLYAAGGEGGLFTDRDLRAMEDVVGNLLSWCLGVGICSKAP